MSHNLWHNLQAKTVPIHGKWFYLPLFLTFVPLVLSKYFSKIRINFSFKSRTGRFQRILPPLANKFLRQMVFSEIMYTEIQYHTVYINTVLYSILNCRRVINSRIVRLRICPLLNISKLNQFRT